MGNIQEELTSLVMDKVRKEEARTEGRTHPGYGNEEELMPIEEEVGRECSVRVSDKTAEKTFGELEIVAGQLCVGLIREGKIDLKGILATLEADIIDIALAFCLENQSEAAKRLGISRTKLRYVQNKTNATRASELSQ